MRDQEGTIFLDETRTSQSNGFMDFWLKKNKEYTFEFIYEDYHGISKVYTTKGSNTCITTIKLEK